MVSRVIKFYMEFSRHRLLTQKGTPEFLSSQHTMMQTLQALLASASPITIYACQELFDCLDPKLFTQSLKPKTVFQMPWPLETIAGSVPAEFLAKFDQRDQFEKLLEMRETLREVVQAPQVRSSKNWFL